MNEIGLDIDKVYNDYLVVHIHNQTDIFHLTRQVLLDSALKHNTCCFFYQILAEEADYFNQLYSAFACIIPSSRIEADIYLNVNCDALSQIIYYVQADQLIMPNNEVNYIYGDDDIQSKSSIHLEQLARVFGMPELVERLKK